LRKNAEFGDWTVLSLFPFVELHCAAIGTMSLSFCNVIDLLLCI